MKTHDSPRRGQITVALLPAAAADGALVGALTGLINQVYATAEAGLWRAGVTRTTEDQVGGFVRAGQIAVAWRDGAVAGSVRIRRLDEGAAAAEGLTVPAGAGGLGGLGMLAADPAQRGAGVGRRLVGFAERQCRDRGLATMQLELLVPRDWAHPAKTWLHDWYTRIGYRVVRRIPTEGPYPEMTPRLATPCDFLVYHKDLRNGPGPGR
jgi:GNAT superfamily N-acetyltransferase